MTRKSELSAQAAAIAAQIELKRKQKTQARIAKMLAKKRGDLKRMPLSGKAALEAIKTGKWCS